MPTAQSDPITPSREANPSNATAVHIDTNQRLCVASYRNVTSNSSYPFDGYSLRIVMNEQPSGLRSIPGSIGDEYWFIVDGDSVRLTLKHIPHGLTNKVVYLVLEYA